MKIERWDFRKGENVLFYITEEMPTSVNARIYTSNEGKRNFELQQLEEGIWSFTIDFRFIGKYVAVFSEEAIKKLIAIITVK